MVLCTLAKGISKSDFSLQRSGHRIITHNASNFRVLSIGALYEGQKGHSRPAESHQGMLDSERTGGDGLSKQGLQCYPQSLGQLARATILGPHGKQRRSERPPLQA